MSVVLAWSCRSGKENENIELEQGHRMQWCAALVLTVACCDVPLSLIIFPVSEIWAAVSLCGPCAVLEHQLSR